jgi:hypothetical protein
MPPALVAKEDDRPFSLTVSPELAAIFEREWPTWKQLKTEQEREQFTLRLSNNFNVRWAAVNRHDSEVHCSW